MEVVIDAAKRATDEKSFTDWLQEALTGEGMEAGVRNVVRWEELGWAWFNTVNRETTEPTSTDIIEKLPILDKNQRINELLDQLSAETDPQKKEQIKQHIERIKNASLNIQANPPSRYWIAPDGKEFPVHGSHGTWIQQDKNLKILKSYGIKNLIGLDNIWKQMLRDGWIRISNEPAGSGFQIEAPDLHNLPPYLDDFIARNFKQGDDILIGNGYDKGIFIDDPFPSIQKAVNKQLMRSKQASLDEVLDQTTQDAIASEYGPSMLIALRFYNDAVRYGQSPDRAVAYALEEVRRMRRPIEQKDFMEVLDTYF